MARERLTVRRLRASTGHGPCAVGDPCAVCGTVIKVYADGLVRVTVKNPPCSDCGRRLQALERRED